MVTRGSPLFVYVNLRVSILTGSQTAIIPTASTVTKVVSMSLECTSTG